MEDFGLPFILRRLIMENCIFCKIINKQSPSSLVYEDDDVVAFLDISQATKGHTLVLPKKHYSNLLEIDEEVLAKIIKVAKLIASSMINSLGAKGFNLVNNCNVRCCEQLQVIRYPPLLTSFNPKVFISKYPL